LTHCSGLPEDIDLSFPGDRAARLAAVLGSPLRAGMRPGAQFHYSDLGLITMGVIAERVTGAGLDELVRRLVTEPLGMRETLFNPPRALRERCAATEDMPWTGRRMVRGQVHDEKAYHLGGVAGHAGLFSTAADVGRLAQALLAGGTGVLRPTTVAAMLVNRNERFGPDAAHGLGVELDQPWYMGRLAGRWSFGHTGFTGTSLVADPVRRIIAVLLANRVHPTRRSESINPARRALADTAARRE
jgi:CubicO group peptidase (beta-lactamase class C family)